MAVDFPIPACKFDIDYINTMDQAALQESENYKRSQVSQSEVLDSNARDRVSA